MDVALQLVVSGLALGSIYALLALSLVIINKATDVVNFSQGEMAMLGTFAALALLGATGVPLGVAPTVRFSEPVEVMEIASPFRDTDPTATADRLELYFECTSSDVALASPPARRVFTSTPVKGPRGWASCRSPRATSGPRAGGA